MSAEGKEHFIQTLGVVRAFCVENLTIEVSAKETPRHLLLTGPNGSGKSTILDALRAELLAPGQLDAELASARTRLERAQRRLAATNNTDRARAVRVEQVQQFEREVARLEGQPEVQARLGDFPPELPFVLHVPATRTLQLSQPRGPKALDDAVFSRGNIRVGETLQHIVNLKSQAALAKDDGALDDARELTQRLGEFEAGIGVFFSDESARLVFDRHTFDFSIESGGRSVSFNQLPDGLASAVYIWGALTLACEGQRRRGDFESRGWALIDEPELHLHAELQERILPFLAKSFPRVQFIVATHSPAVLASLGGATVFDLRTREAYPSEDLRGVRYGTILTEHFGISSDFDLETTRALRELYAMYETNPKPGTAAFKKMRELAETLGEVPHLLVPATKKLTSRASDE